MESGGRKLLPRIQPAERSSEGAAEPVRQQENGDTGGGGKYAVWKAPMEEEDAPKRKRQHIEDEGLHSQSQSQSQALPSLRHILTGPSRPVSLENDRIGPSRLVRLHSGAYADQGAFVFLAPSPNREFPVSIYQDPRELSFASIEAELMDVFRCAWYLRQHVRQKALSGYNLWYDHILINDAYGIDNILHTWCSRYDPGSIQYPASMLYKNCLWLFFNRSIQPSQPSTAFTQVVDDGLHYLRTIDSLLGPGDKSVLLIPLFLLGTSAFYPVQKHDIREFLHRLDHSCGVGSVNHALRSLEHLWDMMVDDRVTLSWDWEKYQAHDNIVGAIDRSLIELLWDPLFTAYRTSRVRSPDRMDFDTVRFRPGPAPAPPPSVPPPQSEPARNQAEEAEVEYSPPRSASPPRQSTMSTDAETVQAERKDSNAGAPRPFLAPPPPASVQMNSELLQSLNRKSAKTKSLVPPCTTCGKELKNPSDAQKHQLQHSKPFLCREPGCTRTQGFATENDLQRHRKSVHGAQPRIGNKLGYICAACPEPSDGTTRKWWPRLDNFKAHIRRKHGDADEESLIQACVKCIYASRAVSIDERSSSASARRPEDAMSESQQAIAAYHRLSEQRYHQSLHHKTEVSSPDNDVIGPAELRGLSDYHDDDTIRVHSQRERARLASAEAKDEAQNTPNRERNSEEDEEEDEEEPSPEEEEDEEEKSSSLSVADDPMELSPTDNGEKAH